MKRFSSWKGNGCLMDSLPLSFSPSHSLSIPSHPSFSPSYPPYLSLSLPSPLSFIPLSLLFPLSLVLSAPPLIRSLYLSFPTNVRRLWCHKQGLVEGPNRPLKLLLLVCLFNWVNGMASQSAGQSDTLHNPFMHVWCVCVCSAMAHTQEVI